MPCIVLSHEDVKWFAVKCIRCSHPSKRAHERML